MGGTYTQQGDYFLPDLKLPPEDERPIGVWGQRRLRYLREHCPIPYANLKTSGQFRSHLAGVEEQANALFLRLIKDYAASEGVTEQFKVEEPMERIRWMNNIRVRAREIINNNLIYAQQTCGDGKQSLQPFFDYWCCASSVIVISPDTTFGKFLDVIVYGITVKGALIKITDGKAIIVLCLM